MAELLGDIVVEILVSHKVAQNLTFSLEMYVENSNQYSTL